MVIICHSCAYLRHARIYAGMCLNYIMRIRSNTYNCRCRAAMRWMHSISIYYYYYRAGYDSGQHTRIQNTTTVACIILVRLCTAWCAYNIYIYICTTQYVLYMCYTHMQSSNLMCMHIPHTHSSFMNTHTHTPSLQRGNLHAVVLCGAEHLELDRNVSSPR